MALDKTNLCSVGQGGQNSIHTYTTTDTDSTVETADYFMDAYASLRVGDMIWANLNTGSSRETKVYFVATSAVDGVTIDFPTLS